VQEKTMRSIGIALSILLIASVASAQDEAARKVAVEIAARVPLEKAVKGAPYSADTIVESLQTLADGNRITQRTTGRVYRDSEGRTRREEDRDFTFKSSTGPFTSRMTNISIVDPVAGYSYSLNPEQKIAWRTPIGTAGELLNKVEASVLAERRKVETEKAAAELKKVSQDVEKLKAEEAERRRTGEEEKRAAAVRGRGGKIAVAEISDAPLERKTIDGIAVEGRKRTTVIPAGQIGNDQPITIVSEEWRSAELNVLVLTRHSDPRSGDSTYRLTNIIRAEPDRSLFMVPADYTIRETGVKKMEEEAALKRRER
jgi:hypothetical protein